MKRRKVDFADMMQQSKGKHFSTDGKTDRFEARGVGRDEEADNAEEEDGAKGLEYISNKIGAFSKSSKDDAAPSESKSVSKVEEEKEVDVMKEPRKKEKKKKKKKHKPLKNKQMLSFDMDEEG